MAPRGPSSIDGVLGGEGRRRGASSPFRREGKCTSHFSHFPFSSQKEGKIVEAPSPFPISPLRNPQGRGGHRHVVSHFPLPAMPARRKKSWVEPPCSAGKGRADSPALSVPSGRGGENRSPPEGGKSAHPLLILLFRVPVRKKKPQRPLSFFLFFRHSGGGGGELLEGRARSLLRSFGARGPPPLSPAPDLLLLPCGVREDSPVSRCRCLQSWDPTSLHLGFLVGKKGIPPPLPAREKKHIPGGGDYRRARAPYFTVAFFGRGKTGLDRGDHPSPCWSSSGGRWRGGGGERPAPAVPLISFSLAAGGRKGGVGTKEEIPVPFSLTREGRGKRFPCASTERERGEKIFRFFIFSMLPEQGDETFRHLLACVSCRRGEGRGEKVFGGKAARAHARPDGRAGRAAADGPQRGGETRRGKRPVENFPDRPSQRNPKRSSMMAHPPLSTPGHFRPPA